MAMFEKQGSPFLFDEDTKDIVALRDPDGSHTPILTPPEVLAVRNGVGKNVGSITDAQTLTLPGASIGERRTLSDGDSIGVELVWAVPVDQSTAAWCWGFFPAAKYEV